MCAAAPQSIPHSASRILHSALCLVALAVFTAGAAEPVIYWWERGKRKVVAPPEGEPAPRLWARASFATNHPAEGVVAFCCEARGTYMPANFTFFLDAGGVTPAPDYWKRGPRGWNPLHPGETGAWAEITPALNYGYRNIFFAMARDRTGHKPVAGDAMPAFTVEFSHDGTNAVGAISSAGGPAACGLVSLGRATTAASRSRS